MLTDSVKAAAKKNPKKNFVIVDDVIKGQKNVASATFMSNQASYLAGLAAAYTTKTNKVGFVGGAKSSIINLFEAGFKQGVRDGAKALHKKVSVSTNILATSPQLIKLSQLHNQCTLTKPISFIRLPVMQEMVFSKKLKTITKPVLLTKKSLGNWC